MDRYQRISVAASAIALGAGVLLANASRSLLQALKLSTWKELAVEFLIIGLSIVLVRTLLESWLFLAPSFRRILLGDQYVEGTWIDLVKHGTKAAAVGIIQIRASGSSLSYWGENYDLTGTYIGHFKSNMAALSWPNLEFKYTSFAITPPDNAPDPKVQGFGEIIFDVTVLPSRRYHGDCIDSLAGMTHAIEGWKILEESDLNALVNPEERAAAILALARRHFARELGEQPRIGVAARTGSAEEREGPEVSTRAREVPRSI